MYRSMISTTILHYFRNSNWINLLQQHQLNSQAVVYFNISLIHSLRLGKFYKPVKAMTTQTMLPTF